MKRRAHTSKHPFGVWVRHTQTNKKTEIISKTIRLIKNWRRLRVYYGTYYQTGFVNTSERNLSKRKKIVSFSLHFASLSGVSSYAKLVLPISCPTDRGMSIVCMDHPFGEYYETFVALDVSVNAMYTAHSCGCTWIPDCWTRNVRKQPLSASCTVAAAKFTTSCFVYSRSLQSNQNEKHLHTFRLAIITLNNQTALCLCAFVETGKWQ